MLIARLIADIADWETRLSAMREGLRHSEVLSDVDAVGWVGSDERVLEMQFYVDEPQLALNVLEMHFGGCDMLVSDAEIEVPHVFVSDMDSTMIGQECIDELADYAGLKDKIADITERAMQGELDFESALRERVALLRGLEESAVTRCLTERIRPNPGARVLTRTLSAIGTKCVLVTGGFHHFADAVGDQLGFDRVVGNRLEVEGGVLTGGLVGPIVDSNVKAAVLNEEMASMDEGAHSLATGDGANDIPMIEAASYGFAYRAKPKARAAANGRVDQDDLSAILSLLGIPLKEWVED